MSIMRSLRHRRQLLGVIVLSGLAAGCSGIPEEAYRLPQSSLSEREAQTRTFDVSDDAKILQASVALLQDMDYNLDAIEYPLGVLSASKVVDADSAMQKAGLVAADVAMVILSIIGGPSAGGGAYASADDEISLKITLVVFPSTAREGQHTARITLQRVLLDKSERVKEVGVIDDPLVYQEVFEMLSKSLFLDGVAR
jgi:hypothetical protein